jgi:hypothetical protein
MKRGGAMHGFNVNKFLSPGKSTNKFSPEKSLDGTFGVGLDQT